LAQGLGTYFGSTAPTTGGTTTQNINTPVRDVYGNYVPLGYANF